ncbi:hypothetical protein BDR07DRAFT_1280805, partial [Suillus spraguei]
VKLTSDFPKKLTRLYMALHTGHASLNKHLHWIGITNRPSCPHCGDIEETVFHFLTICPHYCHECHALIGALGRKATSIPFLLTKPEATPHLVKYINATGRLKTTFGEVRLPRIPANELPPFGNPLVSGIPAVYMSY